MNETNETGQDAALQDQIEELRRQVASLTDVPWYRKPATVISILAFLFSLTTTAFSAYNSYQEDVRANRRDVRNVIQRLSKLPQENFELMQKYKGHGQGEALSGMINQENNLLATQAAELMERYPRSFESTEYYAVAMALSNSNIVSKVPRYFQSAMDLATTSNDYSVAARALGQYLYSKGDYSEGRRRYEQAMKEVWVKFPERNAYVVNSNDLMTLMYWSQAELGSGNKPMAQQKHSEARLKLAALPPGPTTDSLKNQLDFLEKYIQ